MDERDTLTARYNKALADGDEELARVIGDQLLRLINEKIMREDVPGTDPLMNHLLTCNQCGNPLGVATHIVTGVFCNADCVNAWSVGRRKLKDDPRA